MSKRVFKGNIKTETFAQDVPLFVGNMFPEDKRLDSGAKKQKLIGEILLYQEESIGFIDWREVNIFCEGFLSNS